MNDEQMTRLRTMLGVPELKRVRAVIVEHLSCGGGSNEVVVIEDPTESERRAAALLLGSRPSRNPRIRLPLSRLEQRLIQNGAASSLVEAIEALEGPIQVAETETSGPWDPIRRHAEELDKRIPQMNGWAVGIVDSGRLQRLVNDDPNRGAKMITALDNVLAALPFERGTRRQQLSLDTTGSPRLLDPDSPLSFLVLDALREIIGQPTLNGTEGDRETWASVGVLSGDLSSTVCVLNLPMSGSTRLGKILRIGRGEPIWATLRMLLTEPPTYSGRPVFVCESLGVLATAADVLGTEAPPMVVLGGVPTVAALNVLDTLRDSGCVINYHGAFDWPGVAITQRVLERMGDNGRPWRMSADDYRVALEKNGRTPDKLEGSPEQTPWDPQLSAVMQHADVRIDSSCLIEELIEDLRQAQ